MNEPILCSILHYILYIVKGACATIVYEPLIWKLYLYDAK